VIKPDYLLSGSFGGQIILWNSTTGLKLKTFYGHLIEVTDLLYLEKNHFASSSRDDTIIWNFDVGEQDKILIDGNLVTSLVLLRNGLLASFFPRERTIRVWNYTTGELVQEIGNYKSSFSMLISRIFCISLLQNGNLVSLFQAGFINVWYFNNQSEKSKNKR
jgi:WD40 repeat protein